MYAAMGQENQAFTKDAPQLNPELDRAALAREFSRHGRIQIQRLLTKESAQRMHACLTQETEYGLSFDGGDDIDTRTGLTPQERQEITKAAWRRASAGGFHFLYDKHTLSQHGETYRDPKHYWASVTAFLNGPEFLGLTRQVTGLDQIALADAQATLYRPGQFLTIHNDDKPGPNRLVAYVLSLTTAWRPEWGGLLEFIGEDGQVEAGYVPNFNSLRLFRIPTKHCVSHVAPYANAGRYSITGWLRGR